MESDTYPMRGQVLPVIHELVFVCEEVEPFETVWHVLLLHWLAEPRVVLVPLTVAEVLHQLGGGVAEVKGNGRKGSLMV